MALSTYFRLGRQVPPYVFPTVAVLVAVCFLSTWFLNQPPEVPPEEAVFSMNRSASDPKDGLVLEKIKHDEQINRTNSQLDDQRLNRKSEEFESLKPSNEEIGWKESRKRVNVKEHHTFPIKEGVGVGEESGTGKEIVYAWRVCNWERSMDYIPCLDNKAAIKRLPSIRRFQHRERHCPPRDELPLCLVPLPKDYELSIRWPHSRDEIWLNNVPHTKLVSYKKDQNWVKLNGKKLTFPGGGTQFKFGAAKYIDSVEEYVPDVAWGKHTRVVLDIGCGVASFGGYLFDRDVLTMSLAPKDEHEAQVQLALERGIPALSAVMGTQRLPYPSNAFDLAHCARCRIHWQGDGGKWLMEVNRVLRPGGYFLWSATPVYRNQPEDLDFWRAMVNLTNSMCWNLTIKVKGLSSGVGFVLYQKPTTNFCYGKRHKKDPPLCMEEDNPDVAWYIPLENCMQKIPTAGNGHGAEWPPTWPMRLESTPTWLSDSTNSRYTKESDIEFSLDTKNWKKVAKELYLTEVGINWNTVRNVMDMKAGYAGFAAALQNLSVWVMNVVPIDEPDTLPVIFERGLIGIYHDWCESFSTYPRTYDLLHVDHLFKKLSLRCKPLYTLMEMDRILRPSGWVIFRDEPGILKGMLLIIESLRWKIQFISTHEEEQVLVVQKSFWRPNEQLDFNNQG